MTTPTPPDPSTPAPDQPDPNIPAPEQVTSPDPGAGPGEPGHADEVGSAS